MLNNWSKELENKLSTSPKLNEVKYMWTCYEDFLQQFQYCVTTCQNMEAYVADILFCKFSYLQN